MVSQSLITAMGVMLSVCFVAPVVILMWLMLMRKAKNALFLFLIGLFAFIAGYLVLALPLKLIVTERSFYKEFQASHRILAQLLPSIDYATMVVGAILAFLIIMKSGGITFNRCLAFSVGFAGLSNIYFYGISYYTRLNIALNMKDGELAKHYPKASAEEIKKLEDSVTSLKTSGMIALTVRELVYFVIIAAIVTALVYSVIVKKMVRITAAAFAYVFVFDFINELNSIAGIIISVIMAVPAFILLYKINKEPKKVMIKPESMLPY